MDIQGKIQASNGLIISEGTLKTEDLLSSIYEFLKSNNLNEGLQVQIKEVFDNEPTANNLFHSLAKIQVGKEAAADYLYNETCFHYLNCICPDSYYFGSSEGDGACIGFFEGGEL
jgi:hypothetical protein